MNTLLDLGWPIRAPIALVPICEMIRGGGRSAAYIELFRRLRTDRRVKAVLLDIDSPGGEVTASDTLYLAVRRLREEKPVVAHIRGAGASGAYLLACGATRIVAVPSALVGSIGVISIRPLLPVLLERLGVQFSIHKTGPFKDSGAFYRLPTAEEGAHSQSLIGEFYEYFIAVVARERGLTREAVRALATGEVFWASRGQALGLVDLLGDGEMALELAADLGGAAPRSFTARPARSLPQRLLSSASTALAEELTLRLEALLCRGLPWS